MSSIDSHSVLSRPIKDLVKCYKNESIKIPEHQRNSTVWNKYKRQLFIDSCRKGWPFPSILLYEDDEKQEFLEDGLQRLTALSDFIDDKFTDLDGQKYSEWSEVEKCKFELRQLAITKYSGATDDERIEIFDRFQNGQPLNTGERLHSREINGGELVKFTKEMLLKTDGKYFNRAQNVWGKFKSHNRDKRYSELTNAVALMNGVVHGWNEPSCGITTKYEELLKTLNLPITETMRDEAEKLLVELFSIYEEVDVQKPPITHEHKAVQKKLGNFTGAIVYSFKTHPNDWARLHSVWVNFIVSYRENKSLLDTKIKCHEKADRIWSQDRWNTIYKSVFNIL